MKNLLSDRIKNTPPSFIRTILKTATQPDIISFAGGLPSPVSFPCEELIGSSKRMIEQRGQSAFQYSTTEGLMELRTWIANRYNSKFGMDISAENVLVTTGSQQALDLLGKVLVNEGDNLAIEEPGYLGAIQSFSQYMPNFCPVKLQEDGLSISELKEALKKSPKLLYTVPNFQNPTGLTYGMEKRKEIAAILENCPQTFLVEDDPYGELLFSGQAFPYILGGRTMNSVVLGSFSKTATPGMRLGYVISRNTELLKYLAIAKQASDLHTNIFGQYLLLDYVTHNDYESHIQKIRDLYKKQASAMIRSMEKYFPNDVCFTRPRGGMFLWVTLPEGMSALSLFEKALEKKVAFVPGDPFYISRQNVNAMRLNYTNADEETIEEGIKRLAQVIKSFG